MTLTGNPILSQLVDVKSPITDGSGEVLRDPVSGQPVSQDGDVATNYTVVTTGAACRMDSASGRQIQNERARDGTEVTHILFVEPSLAIDEEDVVTVTDTDGVVRVDNAEVVRVGTPSGFGGLSYHKQVMLRKLRDNGP